MSECEEGVRVWVHISDEAVVEEGAVIGEGVMIWRWVHIRSGAQIGRETSVGGGAYIGSKVQIGARCKIENGAQLHEGAVVGDGVFIGPNVVLCNDRWPRAIKQDGRRRGLGEWELQGVTVKNGASIGAGALVLPGVTIGEWAMIGAGAVVTGTCSDGGIYYGVPARRYGFVNDAPEDVQIRCAFGEAYWATQPQSYVIAQEIGAQSCAGIPASPEEQVLYEYLDGNNIRMQHVRCYGTIPGTNMPTSYCIEREIDSEELAGSARAMHGALAGPATPCFWGTRIVMSLRDMLLRRRDRESLL